MSDTDDGGALCLAHAHRGFAHQMLMTQMAGDSRMRTHRGLVEPRVEVTMHAHMWVTWALFPRICPHVPALEPASAALHVTK